MFDQLCSVYSDSHDNCGRFVDRETGEIIQNALNLAAQFLNEPHGVAFAVADKGEKNMLRG